MRVGLVTGLAAIPLVVDMALALALTKIPILWGGSADKPKLRGWWDMAHEARLDWAMLLGALFLIVTGPAGGRSTRGVLRLLGEGPDEVQGRPGAERHLDEVLEYQ